MAFYGILMIRTPTSNKHKKTMNSYRKSKKEIDHRRRHMKAKSKNISVNNVGKKKEKLQFLFL
jgi:hypothetical protein